MDLLSDIEIERLLRNNEKLFIDYLGKNKKQIREYLAKFERDKQLHVLQDLIRFASNYKKADSDN